MDGEGLVRRAVYLLFVVAGAGVFVHQGFGPVPPTPSLEALAAAPLTGFVQPLVAWGVAAFLVLYGVVGLVLNPPILGLSEGFPVQRRR